MYLSYFLLQLRTIINMKTTLSDIIDSLILGKCDIDKVPYMILNPISYNDAERICFSVNSNNRFYLFSLLEKNNLFISNVDSLKTFKFAYVSSDNINTQCIRCESNKFDIKHYLRKNTPYGGKYIMDRYEKSVYNKLPQFVDIHRGMSLEEYNIKNYGISRTLSLAKANFFKNYYRNGNEEGVVMSLKVPKSDIIAYISSRKEKEVLYIG